MIIKEIKNLTHAEFEELRNIYVNVSLNYISILGYIYE